MYRRAGQPAFPDDRIVTLVISEHSQPGGDYAQKNPTGEYLLQGLKNGGEDEIRTRGRITPTSV